MRATDFDLEREQIWLKAIEHPDMALTQAQVAALVGLSQSQVSRRLARARSNRPERDHFELIAVDGQAMSIHGCDRHHEMRLGDRKVCLNCGMAAPFMVPATLVPKPAAKFKPKRPRKVKPAKQAKQVGNQPSQPD